MKKSNLERVFIFLLCISIFFIGVQYGKYAQLKRDIEIMYLLKENVEKESPGKPETDRKSEWRI